MSAAKDHFKEPLDKLNQVIEKLEANVGVQEKKEATVEVTTPAQEKKVEHEVKEEKKEQKNEERKEEKKEQKEEKPKEQKPKQDKPKEEKPKEQKKPKQEKKPKEQKKPKEPATVVVEKKEEGAKEQEAATVDDFAQLDIRIGEIKECWKHPSSENLYCEKIDVGGDVRQIASGLQKYVPIDAMTGPVIVFANLKPRKLADFMSNGMVMANSDVDRKEIKLVAPKGKVGQRIVLEGHEAKFTQEKLPVLNPKKKILEKCIDKFTTDAEGYALWNGMKLKTTEGPILCPIKSGLLS